MYTYYIILYYIILYYIILYYIIYSVMCGICSSKGNPQLDRFTHLFPGSAAGRQPLNMWLRPFKIYRTNATLRFTCHMLSTIFFEHRLHLFMAERPLMSLASTWAPAASSTRQISAWPKATAVCSAVDPKKPSLAAAAPGTVRTRCRTAPAEPRWTAWRRLLPPRATGHGPRTRGPHQGK